MTGGWIGVDLDGTLAKYDGWRGMCHIGEPIQPMVDRVKKWLDEGWTVKIMTARVCSSQTGPDKTAAHVAIRDWCKLHIGQALQVTSEKDFQMVMLWDDRCVRVAPNTGSVLCPLCGDDPTAWPK